MGKQIDDGVHAYNIREVYIDVTGIAHPENSIDRDRIEIRTNLLPSRINFRGKGQLFSSNERVLGWARRIRESRRVAS